MCERLTLKKNRRDQSKLLAGDAQLLVHRQCRKPNIDPIKISNNEKEEANGNHKGFLLTCKERHTFTLDVSKQLTVGMDDGVGGSVVSSADGTILRILGNLTKIAT